MFSNGTTIQQTNLKDCYVIKPKHFGDQRGYFCPFYIKEYLDQLGFKEVVQTNRSKSSKNVLRGLHFQKEPYAQAKLVEVIHGAAIDLVVDYRPESPTYMQHTYVYLSPLDTDDPESGRQLFVPRGFAHGFISLEDDTVFQYLIDNVYMPSAEDGLRWDDPKLNIPWADIVKPYGIDMENIIISDKDRERELLH